MDNVNVTCFNCGNSLPDKGFFCPNCMTQVRCKNCQSLILKDAIGCIECGDALVVRNKSDEGSLNQIEFEQKGEVKKFKATFTNEVGHTLVETFGSAVVGGHFISRKRTNPFVKTLGNPDELKKNLKEGIEIAEAEIEETDLNEELTNYFKQDGEALVLINPRLKQTSKLDNAIRLTILTLYAYEQLGQSEIERKVLQTVLKSSKLNIAAFSTWINKCDEIIRNGSKIQLSVPGRDTAKNILKELADPNVERGEIKFSKLSGAGGSRKKKNSDEITDGEKHDTKVAEKKSSSRKSTVSILNELISEGFFDQKRKILEIVKYCKDNKAVTFKTNELSTPLARLIKNKTLKREKNSDSQYEYFR